MNKKAAEEATKEATEENVKKKNINFNNDVAVY